ncbi:Hypothetical predicted protein [Octopus vulgaris]|uniref:Uncharacterized protein n=1 Tax=Octopus vulgaris TaxID=6645 RepID=A0AA36FKF4_OCTVU|nr:Hypothetical predicted protein [Octopus vulgaris]
MKERKKESQKDNEKEKKVRSEGGNEGGEEMVAGERKVSNKPIKCTKLHTFSRVVSRRNRTNQDHGDN